MTAIKLRNRFIQFMVGRQGETTFTPVQLIEERDGEGEAANEKDWRQRLNRIRKYEYPIDYDAK